MDRADDLLTLSRLAAGPGAVAAILDWLRRRTGGATVLLVDADGRILAGPAGRTRPGPVVRRLLGTAVADLPARGTAAGLAADAASAVHVVELTPAAREAGDRAPYLAVVSSADQRLGTLLGDAARTLGLCWWLAEAERDRRRFASADAQGREAVLHLLMVGDVPPAQRIAAALRPRLPALLRVCVVESVGGRRTEIAARIEGGLRGRIWLVPCPVRANHLIALVPTGAEGRAGAQERAGTEGGAGAVGPEGAADPELSEPVDRVGRMIVDRVPGCRVGVSEPVALRDTAIGYEQAFHALAVARAGPDRYARFDRPRGLPPPLGPDGYAWARRFLMPCLSYQPARRADPGARELLGTLTSWLAFDNAASRHLKIHRNTLASRLRLLDRLLGIDLTRVGDQSTAWLAIRLGGTGPGPPPSAVAAPDATADPGFLPSPGGGIGQVGSGAGRVGPGAGPAAGAPLDWLVESPAFRAWAEALLLPLRRADQPAAIETVRAWLAADAGLAAASAALGISAPATRKRLVRAEQALGRSLLHAPSARHELWLAMRSLNLIEDSREAVNLGDFRPR